MRVIDLTRETLMRSTADHAQGSDAPMRSASGEPRLASLASWAVLAASFGLSAATWIDLAELAGFVGSVSLRIGASLRLAWLMPIAVDGYLVVALVLWMAPVPPRVARFARTNTYAAALVGVVAQSAYHSLTVYAASDQLWRAILAAAVGALPPAVAALAVHMRALIRRESGAAAAAQPRTDAPLRVAAVRGGAPAQTDAPQRPASPAAAPASDAQRPAPVRITRPAPVASLRTAAPTPEPTAALGDDAVIAALRDAVLDAHRRGDALSQRELQAVVAAAHPGAPVPGPRRLGRLVAAIVARAGSGSAEPIRRTS